MHLPSFESEVDLKIPGGFTWVKCDEKTFKLLFLFRLKIFSSFNTHFYFTYFIVELQYRTIEYIKGRNIYQLT